MQQPIEYDLILMSLVIFLPTVFAIGLMIPWFFPRGRDEWMRWWTLFGTAATMVLSFCMFISYYTDVFDAHRGSREATLLSTRVQQAETREEQSGPARNRDWVTRHPWIERFNIEY